MADFSISDMPWLGQPADPAGSLARGIQAGSMIAQTRNQREALALRRMEFEEAQRERAKLLPLEITLQQQQNKMKALEIENVLEQRQLMIDNAELIKAVGSDVSFAITENRPEDAYGHLARAISVSGGKILRDPRFIEFRKFVDETVNASTDLLRAKSDFTRSSATYTPGFETITNPQTGKSHVVFRSGAGSAQLLDHSEEGKPQSPLGKLLADRELAVKAGDDTAVSAYDAEIRAIREKTAFKPQSEIGKILADRNAAAQSGGQLAVDLYDKEIQARLNKAGFALTTNPDGTVTITHGKQSELTPANQTRVQQGLSDSLSTIDIANRLEPLIDTETVGARSFVETWVKDRVLAQAFPEMASNKRASAESLAAQLRASAVRELKTDSNITEKERSQILQSIPDINAPVDSPARAKQLIGDIRKMSAIRAVVSAVKLGQPMPKQAAQVLTDDELVRLRDTGVITADQALQIFDARQ